MNSRLRRRALITIGLVLVTGLSCRWYGDAPTLTLSWAVVVIILIALWLVLERRYQRPYRLYAIGIAIVTWAVVHRVGLQLAISLPVIMLYAGILVTLLLSRMHWPVRWWTIPLLARLIMGGLILIPRSPQPFAPTTIVDTLPTLQVYRERQSDDEQLSVIVDDDLRQMRSDQWTSIDGDAFVIQYSSTQLHEQTATIQFSNLTTLRLGAQSALRLTYDDHQWSGSLDGSAHRQTSTEQKPMQLAYQSTAYVLTGAGSLGRDDRQDVADQYHDRLLSQAFDRADDIRPSPWTQTMIGARLLRLKLSTLSTIDQSYTDDLQQLYQYQCLVYGQRCDYVDTTRQHFSLGAQTWDADLQSTALSGTAETLQLWNKVKGIIGY